VPNLHEPEFDQERDQPGFECRRAYLGRQAGSRRLGASLWELRPGQAVYPYHYHLAEEELLFVISGRPSLRTPGGWRDLEEGEVVAFLVGEEGGHQLVNRSDEPARVLVISNAGMPEICIYPDSGKLGAYDDPPAGSGLRELFRLDDSVDYWEGESAPQ
jgi:uncharacterized cupin superfamily protein